jgi:Carboxypeptidase regulatory-like domain
MPRTKKKNKKKKPVRSVQNDTFLTAEFGYKPEPLTPLLEVPSSTPSPQQTDKTSTTQTSKNEPNVFTISGTVAKEEGGPAGVTVKLSGAATKTTVTKPGGAYLFAGLPAGAYTVTAENGTLVFEPQQHDVANLEADETLDFSLKTFVIRVRVKPKGTEPSDAFLGVTKSAAVALSGSKEASASSLDSGGEFVFLDLPAGGNFIVTLDPGVLSIEGPTTATITGLAKDEEIIFEAKTVSIRGSVKRVANDADAIMAVEFAGESEECPCGPDGAFEFTGLPAGLDFTVKSANLTFNINPNNHAFKKLDADTSAANFGLVCFTISGRVLLTETQGWGGGAVAVTGSRNSTVPTDPKGNFTVKDLRAGGAYELTVSGSKFCFDPTPFAVANLQKNENVTFTKAASSLLVKVEGIQKPEQNAALFTVKITGKKEVPLSPQCEVLFSGAAVETTITLTGPTYYTIPKPLKVTGLKGNVNQSLAVTRNTYTISGNVTKASNGAGFDGVSLTLRSYGQPVETVQSSGGGNFTFAPVTGGEDYDIIPSFAVQPGKERWTTWYDDYDSDELLALQRDIANIRIQGTTIISEGPPTNPRLYLPFGGRRAKFAVEMVKNLEGTRKEQAGHTVALHVVQWALSKFNYPITEKTAKDNLKYGDDTLACVVGPPSAGDHACVVWTCFWKG